MADTPHDDSAALEVERLRAEIGVLRQALWDCYAFAGGDTHGDPTPVAITSPLAPMVLDCVRDLAQGYKDRGAAITRAERIHEQLEGIFADV